MIFVFNKWETFCKQLADNNKISIRISDCFDLKESSFLVLKHDVETDVKKAYQLAEIEHKFGHKGTYYVQAYLLNDTKNIHMLKKMQEMGHEISYHFDVMDSNKGDIDKAIIEFENNVKLFRSNGFDIKTLCQHGNPIIERIGYTSNRDFFRNEKIQILYSNMCDVMVDFHIKANVCYDYYSDAGRKFNLIFDPITNDIVNSDDKNVPYENLDKLISAIIENGNNAIISTHPHRWEKHMFAYYIKSIIFNTLKTIAKILIKIPGIKKVMSRYYHLAKKI